MPDPSAAAPIPSRISLPCAEDMVFTTALPLPGRRQGKVRDLYRIPPIDVGVGDLDRGTVDHDAGRMLLIATDRISAFDVVMPTAIAGKGRLLTAMSLRWFGFIRRLDLVDDHLISDRVEEVPAIDDDNRRRLRGRIMLCAPATVVPIECVARGYLAGSGWVEYRHSRTVCGIPLPDGLREGDRLPEPIFTPATKAEIGHDENITFDDAATRVGHELMVRLRGLTLDIYRAAHDYAVRRGIVIADTKLEFGHAIGADGRPTDRLLLVDEVLTPDSSRFWPADCWTPGRAQPSFDKQFLREWLLTEEHAGRWDRQPPGPTIPPEIVLATLSRYQEAFDRLWCDPEPGVPPELPSDGPQPWG